jgi:hypothetical protein
VSKHTTAECINIYGLVSNNPHMGLGSVLIVSLDSYFNVSCRLSKLHIFEFWADYLKINRIGSDLSSRLDDVVN